MAQQACRRSCLEVAGAVREAMQHLHCCLLGGGLWSRHYIPVGTQGNFRPSVVVVKCCAVLQALKGIWHRLGICRLRQPLIVWAADPAVVVHDQGARCLGRQAAKLCRVHRQGTSENSNAQELFHACRGIPGLCKYVTGA